jgi:hypothetical protein
MALIGSVTSSNIASPTIVSPTVSGTLDLASASSINDNSSLKRVRRTFPFSNQVSTIFWTKLGTLSIHNGSQLNQTFGGGCIIRALGQFGFNSTDVQQGYTEIVMWGSNNNTAPNNINGKFSTTGNFGSRLIHGVKAKSVNGSQFDNTYDIWVSGYFYAPNGMIEVTTSDGWIWTWASDYGTFTTTDPGSASNTVRVFKYKTPSYGCAAFARIRGSDGAILDAYNISSVTKNSLDYRITFTNPMADNLYAILGTASFDVGTSGDISVCIDSDSSSNYTTDLFEVRLNGGTSTFFCVAVFSNY